VSEEENHTHSGRDRITQHVHTEERLTHPYSSGVLGTCTKLIIAQIPLSTAGMVKHLLEGCVGHRIIVSASGILFE
jgi:hypothetical protein